MTWTYSGDPSSSDRDAVRFLIGDTDTTDQQLSDEELDYLLLTYTNVYAAAQEAAQSLLAKYSRLVDKSVGDLSLSYSQRITNYKELIKTLKNKSAFAQVGPFAGGLSKARKDTVKEDSDRVIPAFERDQFRLDDVPSDQNDSVLPD